MSRIGNKPVAIPNGVKVAVDGGIVKIEGPKGKLEFAPHRDVAVKVDGKNVVVSRSSDERGPRSLHGLTRAIINNMCEGVTKGYEKRLEVQGVGYVVSLQGKTLALRVGFANEVKKQIPTGLTVTCPDNTHVVVQGCDKQLVG